MTLSDLSIRRPVFAWMLMSSFIIFGFIGLGRLGVSELPDVDFPVLTINLSWQGAAPSVMETEMVERVEEAVIAVQGLRDMTSSVQLGQAAITLEFDIDRNIDAALTEVQSKISTIRLPIGSDPATITKTNPEDEPIILLSVSGKRSLHDQTQYIQTVLADKFRLIPGVGEVVLGGYNQRNLRVWVDNEKLKPLQLTITDIQTAIQNENLEVASGYLENKRHEINVRTMGEGITPEQIGEIQIKSRGGQAIYKSWIRIKDVARVEDGLDDIQHLGVVAGGTGLALGIKKQRGSNAVEVARLVKKKLVELRPTLPPDMTVEVNFDSSKFIEEAIGDTETTLILSALITCVVCFLFLGSWSSTINVLLSIPTSVMGTFLVMYFMGFTLNFFTLLGLSLAIGIIVDDAIMVLENIVRHAEMGKDKVQAATDGAREITFAAIVATAAVMAIFLPVIFMEGIIGKYFYQFGVTISAAVLLSLVEAITITPMRCSQFLSTQHTGRGLSGWADRTFAGWAKLYSKILALCMANRWKVIGLATLLFLVSLGIGLLLRMEFIPPQDQSAFLIHVQTPVGSSIHYTADKLAEAEQIIKSYPEVDHIFAVIGGFVLSTGSSDGNIAEGVVNSGTIYVTLKPLGQRHSEISPKDGEAGKDHGSVGQYQIMERMRNQLNAIPDILAVPQDLSSKGFTSGRGYPVELNLRGDNYELLNETAQKIIARLRGTGLMMDFDTDLRTGMTEVQVIPDREAASRSGISIQSIANTVSDAIGGVVQGQFTNGNRRYDIRIRLEGTQRAKKEDIEALQIRSSGNELLPLTDVVHLEEVKTYQTMTRRLRERSISIFANVVPGKSQAKALEVAEKIAKEEMPSTGARLFLGGGALAFREAFSSLIFALFLGILIAYMVLASQFNSFVHPFTVLIALPFSVSGAFLALLVTHQSLNLYSMIGLILLMGIVKKNSILLVEFANQRREKAAELATLNTERAPLSAHQAMIEAAPIRLRPILMTSMATLAAAIPPALALGPGAESRIPLAVTVLGGVTLSTAFTLLVVPCAYSLLSRLEHPFTRTHPAKKHSPAPTVN